jgi:chloride channel 2
MNRYLSFKNLIGKVLGLICTFGAGLSVGKEGPFCHIGGMFVPFIF